MAVKYFVINVTADGPCIATLTETELLERINSGDYYDTPVKFNNTIPDLEYLSDGITVIKGEIITPKPVETVTEYAIPK